MCGAVRGCERVSGGWINDWQKWFSSKSGCGADAGRKLGPSRNTLALPSVSTSLGDLKICGRSSQNLVMRVNWQEHVTLREYKHVN